MEDITQALILIGGFLLRFGLPVIGTGALIFILKRLDQRWQEEGTVQFGVLDVYAAAGQEPCWEQKQCTPERRAACQAYQDTGQPCWQFARDESGTLKAECLTCDVFVGFPALTPA